MRKKVIIPTIALVAILGAVAVGTMPVSAQGPLYGNLVAKIAQRFNLKESDVQQVFDEVRASRIDEMKTKWEDRVSQLVKEGKITEAQKSLILAKHDEVQKAMQALRDLSPAERKAKAEQIRTDLEKWATENGIDLKLIGMFGHGGFGRGFRMGYKAVQNS